LIRVSLIFASLEVMSLGSLVIEEYV
jgi:hypothetical protein